MFRGLITSWSYALDDAGYSSKDDFDLLLLRADISGARQGDNIADDGHELLVVLGTSFSEPVLPGLLMKLEPLACKRGVVGLVLPPAARIACAALAAASGQHDDPLGIQDAEEQKPVIDFRAAATC